MGPRKILPPPAPGPRRLALREADAILEFLNGQAGPVRQRGLVSRLVAAGLARTPDGAARRLRALVLGGQIRVASATLLVGVIRPRPRPVRVVEVGGPAPGREGPGAGQDHRHRDGQQPHAKQIPLVVLDGHSLASGDAEGPSDAS